MTDKQPEALRLADHLERFRSFPDDLAAAAELRRLHTENEAKDALLRQALDALENAWLDASMGKGDVARHTKAINALRAALETSHEVASAKAEQPAEQEPVAWGDAQKICDLPAVDEAIRALVEDQTNDNAVCLVQAILAESPQPAKSAEQEPVAWPVGSAELHVRLLNMGKAMAKERSREIGDAWNQLADLLALLAKSRISPPAEPARMTPAELADRLKRGEKWQLAEQPAEQEPWTPREIELIDGMIEVQLNHAERCDHIANRTMAEKQKGWDMERVALLQKIRGTASQPAKREPQ